MGMKLDAPVATNALDSSGEVLSIQGLDITDFLEGRAVANWEHSNTSEDGAVGHFIYAKKIFSAADCETPRQLSFWRQLGHEFLYGIVELYDDEGHPGAVSIAAMARYFIKRKEKIKIGMSIEGSTLDRDGHLLNRAVARKAAITLTPCNKECWVEFAGDESQPIVKSESVEVVDFEFDSFDDLLTEISLMENELNKGLKGDWQKEGYTLHHEGEPSYGHSFTVYAKNKHGKQVGFAGFFHAGDQLSPEDVDVDSNHQRKGLASAMYDHAQRIGRAKVVPSENQSEQAELFWQHRLNKNYNMAPSTLTGQAALSREDIGGRVHNTLKAVLRDWDKKKPLREMVKAALPQLTDNFVDHFTAVAQEMALKKAETILPQNIVPFSPIINEQQQALLEGLTIPDSQNQFEVNAAGQKVILREENDGGKQAAFSFLMDKYFGLGEFFPISNHFTYKSKDFTAELMVENSIIQPKEQFHSSLGQMKMDGTLYKLHIADLILGKFSPRTNMSMLFADGKPVCTYTKDIFMYDLTKLKPMNDLMSDMIPLEVIGWLESKSSNNLKLQMSLLGLSRNQINQAVQIKSIIEMNRHQTLGNIIEAIAGQSQQSEIKPEFTPDLLG